MREMRVRPANPQLKELVVEASQALARLDGARIDELSLSCQALNRDLATYGPDERRELARQAQEAAADMAVFARVLEATRSNLGVMKRLKELRAGRLEYGETAAAAVWGGVGTEGEHGND